MNRNTTQHATATPCFSRLALAVLLAVSAVQTAVAQSTGTLATEGMEEIIVTGQGALNMAGVTAQDAAKSRVTVTGDMLKNYASGQTFLDSLNQVPGLNFTNNDPYGSSGGNLRLRGFDGSRVSLTFDGIVICAGVHGRGLAAQLGDRLNIYPVKGYSITVGLHDAASQAAAPQVSLLDDETKLVTSRLGADRFRVAGTAEFNGIDLNIRADRIKPLVNWVNECFPGVDTRRVEPWAGLRPMMPNMLPRVGAGKKANVFYNTGHGHLGWTLSAITAHQLAGHVMQSMNTPIRSALTPVAA